MPRDVILFDLDGTLVDSARDIATALTELSVARGGGLIPVEAVRPLVSFGAATLVTRALGSVARDPVSDVAAFRECLRAAPSDPRIVFGGVVQALETLRGAGWKMAVVTNKPCSLATALLQAHDLQRFFGAVVGGDTTAEAKPEPAPVRHALTLLGSAPEAALFVGDSDVDAHAAARLAIPFILFSEGYGASGIAPAQVAARFRYHHELPMVIAACR